MQERAIAEITPNSLPMILQQEAILADLRKVLQSGRLILGPQTRALEDEFLRLTGRRWAVAVSSGTAALEIAFRYLGLGGHDVIIPANIFVADKVAVVRAGGRPVCCDVSPKTGVATRSFVEAVITGSTKACLLFHSAGFPVPDSEEIARVCDARGIKVVEDGSHAHGAKQRGKPVGTLGWASCFSLYPTKVVTGGAGGVLATDDEGLANYARVVRHHGMDPGGVMAVCEGYNWCLTELDATVALHQMRHLSDHINARQKLAEYYDRLLSEQDWLVAAHRQNQDSLTAYYKYVVKLPAETRVSELVQYALEAGFQLGHCYRAPVYRQPPPVSEDSSLPGAEEYAASHVTLPLYIGMSNRVQEHVVRTILQWAPRHPR